MTVLTQWIATRKPTKLRQLDYKAPNTSDASGLEEGITVDTSDEEKQHTALERPQDGAPHIKFSPNIQQEGGGEAPVHHVTSLSDGKLITFGSWLGQANAE